MLDNFEHVVMAGSLVGELVSACPQLKVLITSRAVLHVSNEREFRVPPLALPQSDTVRCAEDLMQYGAANLFGQRVLAINPQLEMTDGNARTVAEICIRFLSRLDYDAARSAAEESVALYKGLDDRWGDSLWRSIMPE